MTSKDINRKWQFQQAKTRQYAQALQLRLAQIRQYESFARWLLAHGRVTKEELRPWFKRKKDLAKELKL